MGMKGIVASAAGLVASCSTEGIGDTIRVSLTPQPGGDRTEEVLVAQQVLQSLGLRSFMPAGDRLPRLRPHHEHVLPGDGGAHPGRTCASRCRSGAARYPGVEEMSVAVMGCVVNGPGESKHANIGISLPGTFEEPKAPVYVDGALRTTLRGDGIVEEFIGILEDYVARRYGSAAAPDAPVPIGPARSATGTGVRSSGPVLYCSFLLDPAACERG